MEDLYQELMKKFEETDEHLVMCFEKEYEKKYYNTPEGKREIREKKFKRIFNC